jgi:hypothetical protein
MVLVERLWIHTPSCKFFDSKQTTFCSKIVKIQVQSFEGFMGYSVRKRTGSMTMKSNGVSSERVHKRLSKPSAAMLLGPNSITEFEPTSSVFIGFYSLLILFPSLRINPASGSNRASI